MQIVVLLGLVVLIVWSLIAHRFEHRGVAGPLVLIVAGSLVVLLDKQSFAETIDAPVTEKVVELVLAVLLFVDATEVRGGIFGGEGRNIARLLLIALPLAFLLSLFAADFLLPEINPFVVVLIACVLAPVDFAGASVLLRARFVPERVRRILNVEAGYTDGMVAPVFGMTLPLALVYPYLVDEQTAEDNIGELEKHFEDFAHEFLGAVPAMVIAITVGIAIGALTGFLARVAIERKLANATGVRYVMLLVPLLTFAITSILPLHVNGFVASFVAGVMYRFVRTRKEQERAIPHEELILVEEVGTLVSQFVWFMFGALTTLVVTLGANPVLIVLAVLALTVFRLASVYASLLRSSVRPRDRILIGLLGPRGTPTVVFGLLAFSALPDDEGMLVLSVMVFTVLGSVVLQGVVAPLVLRREAARHGALSS